MKKMPSNKKMKEIYINKLKILNNDLKISLKKTQEEGMNLSSRKKQGDQELMSGTERVANLETKPNKTSKAEKIDVHKDKDFQDSPLTSKQVKGNASNDQKVTKLSSTNLKPLIKNGQKLKKKDLIKKKNLNFQSQKNRKNGRDSRRKEKIQTKNKGNEKKMTSNMNVKTQNSDSNMVTQSTSGRLKMEKNDPKLNMKKPMNAKQHGRMNQKKSANNGGYSSKKPSKVNTSQNKSSFKGNGADKIKKKANEDDEKPPNKPNPKLEKGHYIQDHPSGTKPKNEESNKSKIKIKRGANGILNKKKMKRASNKNKQENENMTSLKEIGKESDKEKEQVKGNESFEPERALKKKVAKKKNFSLNLDTFKSRMAKDYHTHVDKFVSSIEKKNVNRSMNKKFNTEKQTSKNVMSSQNNVADMEKDDIDYKKVESLSNNNLNGERKKNRNSRHRRGVVKNKSNTNKLMKAQTGIRRSGTYSSQIRKQNNRTSNDATKRKKSKGRITSNDMRASANYKKHLMQKEIEKRDSSSKGNARNSSIKELTRRNKKNLSNSINKRIGLGNMRKTSNEPLKNRKKTHSINPGNRFMIMEKMQRKRAASETRSVSNISFTDLEKAGIRKTKNIVEYIKQREHILPPFTKARSVVKDFGIIKGFVVNTHKGCVRAGNEDRVSILLNAQHKFRKSERKMNNCAMFSVFDGHGGTDCCNFLKENLHNKILADLDIHNDFDTSMKKIFTEVDATYLKRAIKKKQNYSGSCANCLFVLDDKVVVVNTGDSRTVCSKNKGKEFEAMSIDHKPGCFDEFSRVIKNGGQLYRVSSHLKTIENMFYTVTNYSDVLQIDEVEKTNKNLCFGPWRVKPGGLSVSRSFGDMESKILKNGKRINLVIAEPEIFKFDPEPLDFAILASDGVYDKLSNQQVVETVWETIEYYKNKYKKIVEKRKARKRNTSINRQMKSSLNSNRSSRLSSQVRKIKQGKSYSQVFDDQKKRQSSRKHLRSNSRGLNSSYSRNRSNRGSSTSIKIESGREMEKWEEEMRKKYDEILGECVNNILKRSLLNQSEDNVTLIMLVFRDLIKP
jgi:protein phosphatase 2C family protein 2/3